ncbi:hypothetical protein AMAG_09098 [Allomyces macrogynus ATCC 38327]|uniref:Uncharacterized protein n=1 Tax=Allomyces macrogynus (strain ATCC 38327) TaxID=578462 RepID=A0A0L0SNE7_ALLM3|nr:hypothetical protein AMAG_09098 [Allomyces macrogynus ATCC 38327]|eukprot:KNE64041.1 hypothetical protein AMAG_09098 [Allomyces macrogynus ATCC 38327]
MSTSAAPPATPSSRPSASAAPRRDSRPSAHGDRPKFTPRGGSHNSSRGGARGGGHSDRPYQQSRRSFHGNNDPHGIVKRRVEQVPIYSPAAYEHHTFMAIVHAQHLLATSFKARRNAAKVQAERALKLARRKRTPTHIRFDDDGDGEAMDVDMDDEAALDPRERRRRQLAKTKRASVRAQIWPPPGVEEAEGGTEAELAAWDAEAQDQLVQMQGDVLDQLLAPVPPSKPRVPALTVHAQANGETGVIVAPALRIYSHDPRPVARVGLSEFPRYNAYAEAINATHRAQRHAAAVEVVDKVPDVTHVADVDLSGQKRSQRGGEKVVKVRASDGTVVAGAQYLPARVVNGPRGGRL